MLSTRRNHPLRLVGQFTYLVSNISSTESDVTIRPAKAWNYVIFDQMRMFPSRWNNTGFRLCWVCVDTIIWIYYMEVWPSRLGQQNTQTSSLQKSKSPPTSVLDMILNNPMVRLQKCWSFGECGVSLSVFSLLRPLYPGVVVFHRVLSMG